MLKKTLSLLLDYSITNTDYGKITLSCEPSVHSPEQLLIRISDTGTDISGMERDNLVHRSLRRRYPIASGTIPD